MSRARNIKPSFFDNEDLAEMPYENRLLFIGLWNLADREGRLENRPKRIKKILFAFDDMDVKQALIELQKYNFIEIYEMDGLSVIQVTNFLKHQSPHGLEKDSELPDKNGFYTVWERGNNKTITRQKQLFRKPELNNSNLKHEDTEKTVIEPLYNSYSTVIEPLHNALNPDCGILNPDLLNPEIKEHVNEDVHATVSKPEKLKDEINNVFEHWKKVMNKRGTVILDSKRKSAIRARLVDGYTQDQLCKAVDGCSMTDHNMGKTATNKTLYNDLTLICRDAEHVDRFMATAGEETMNHEENTELFVYEPPKPLNDRTGSVSREEAKRFAQEALRQMGAAKQ